ncbi:MAG: hypothetical protein NVSMB17_10910 [Candidatus Dormibacteria bacterium]
MEVIQLLRLSELNGRAVVDMALAEKLGEIDEAVLDPEGRRVAGFMVTKGSTLLGGGHRMVFAASAVHSVGPDAVTVHGAILEHAEGAFPGLPRRRDIVGRKIVGHSGKMYGHIHDVLIDGASGEIIGYSMEDAPRGGLDGIFGAPRTSADLKYVRADADLRVGSEIVVVPDEAVVHHNATDASSLEMPARAGEWSMAAAHADARPSAWVDQRAQPPAAAPAAAPSTTSEGLPHYAAPQPLPHEPLAYEPLAHEPLAHEPLAHEPLAHEPLPHEPLPHDPAAEPSYEEMTFGTPAVSPPLHEGESRPF